MSVRVWALTGAVCIVLAACGARGDGKTDQSSAERISAALDICGEGAGAFAQNVCDNQDLAALDGEIREALVAQSADVSDAGAQMLVQNQRRWREAARIECGVVDPEAAPNAEAAACLEGEFRARLQQARSAVQEVGGYTFQRMELVDAAPVTQAIADASGLGEGAPRAMTREIRFPRIDGAQTPEIQRFNDLVAQQPQQSLEDGASEVVDYEIVYAGPEIVSVRFASSDFTLGAAHPNNSAKAVTVLMSEGRPIAAADVFAPESGWEDFVTARAVTAITREFRDYDFTPPERDVRESATKSHLWLITERGLTIVFPPYSFGGPHVLGGVDVSIPWTDLRPYLSPSAPAPIRPTA